MTTIEIAKMIDTTGIQNAYYQFEDGRELSPPWICFYYPESDDLYADSENYQHITNLTIELYSPYKDFDSEKTIENVLKANGLTWAKIESYEEDQQLYVISYEMEVLINGNTE